MNQSKKDWWRNYYSQKIRFSNRSGSHENCIRLSKGNTWEHEFIKIQICWKLLELDYPFWTEAIFEKNQGRADIFTIVDDNAYALEIETNKPSAELQKKIKSKEKYPEEINVLIINSKDFDINTFSI